MVETIKKVKLIFIGTGIGRKYQAYVKVYDCYNNLVYKGITKNGCLNLFLSKNTIYKVNAFSFGECINSAFYVNPCNNKYVFVFRRSILNINNSLTRTITFLLTDANYNNLPIEEGKINLWKSQ